MTNQEIIPRWLGRLSNSIYEELVEEHRFWWYTELAKSVSTKTDFQSAFHTIQTSILEMTLENKDKWGQPYRSQCVKAIEGVIDCHRNPEGADWIAAARATTSAAGAAWSTDSAARRAVMSAAWSTDSAVLSAADAVLSAAASADSATWKAAKSAAYYKIAKAIIKIFTAMKKEQELIKGIQND